METADELEMVDLLQNDVAQVCRGVTGGHQDVHILGWTLELVFGGKMKLNNVLNVATWQG